MRLAEGLKRKVYLRIWKWFTDRVFPFWDSQYLYEMDSIWLADASKNMDKYADTVKKDRMVRQMLVASELCRRLADDTATDIASKEMHDWIAEQGGWSLKTLMNPMPEGMGKRFASKEKELRDYYLLYLGTILYKHSLEWWD